jgi:hypothetical protein
MREQWHYVELTVVAGEARIGEEAKPGLADEGGADEALWIFRREAEEDLANEVVHEPRRRRRHHFDRVPLLGEAKEIDSVVVEERSQLGLCFDLDGFQSKKYKNFDLESSNRIYVVFIFYFCFSTTDHI